MTLIELQAEAYKVVLKISELNNYHIKLQQDMNRIVEEDKLKENDREEIRV